MMKHRLLALFCAFTLLLGGCVVEETEQNFWEDDVIETDEMGGQVLLSSFSLPYLEEESLNPYFCPDGIAQTVTALQYESLFALDRNMTPQGVLCESWQYDSATLTYYFVLRKNVTFWDGTVLTAEDVRSSWDYAARSTRYSGRFRDVRETFIMPDGTLRVTLKRANANFPALLDVPIVRSGTESSALPTGTGPYWRVETAEGDYLTANSTWWKSAVLPFAQIPLVPVKSEEMAAQLFSSYDISFMLFDPTLSYAFSQSGAVTTETIPNTTMQWICFRADMPYALRQAMDAAIDRKTIVSGYLSGYGSAAHYPISAASPLYPTTAVADSYLSVYRDKIAAMRYRNLIPDTLTFLVNAENSYKVRIVEYLCEYLSTENLTLTPLVLPWEEYVQALTDGAYHLCYAQTRLTADWDCGELLRVDGALNYGAAHAPASEHALSVFLAEGSIDSANAFAAAFASELPFLPICFGAYATISYAGSVEGQSPALSNPFYGIENWSVNFAAS